MDDQDNMHGQIKSLETYREAFELSYGGALS